MASAAATRNNRQRLLSFFSFEAGEARPTLLLTCYLLLAIASVISLKATSKSLFLTRFTPRELPFVYLSIAALMGFIVTFYLKLSARLPQNRLILYTQLFLASHLVLFWCLLRLRLDWRHAGLRQIGRLYLPIILGLVISNLAVLISAKLIAATGEQSIAWNDYATSLMQFPLGLVVTAVSVAILPTLAQKAVTSEAEFKATLAQGLKLVMALILPAVVGMTLLARPINALLYEHGTFTARDTEIVSLVLRVQMIGVFFAAIDQPLIFAFYARKDTLTPALVGMAGVGLYLFIAFAISRLRPLTLLDLVFANDAQLAAHALVMLALFRRRLGGFDDPGVWTTCARAGLASLVMGALAWVTLLGVLAIPAEFAHRLFAVVLPGAVGVVAYFWLAARLNIIEVRLAVDLIRRRLGL